MRKPTRAAIATRPLLGWPRSPRASFARTLRTFVLLTGSACPFASAQDGPSFCLPPPNSARHPLFGTPVVRVGVEGVGIRGLNAVFGDLNGDGLPDAAVILGATPPSAYLSICYNRGGGVFGQGTIYTLNAEACAVEVGDFDHDGGLDLAVANAMGNSVSILLNRGDGTFAAPVSYAVGNQPRSLKVGDLNRDGLPDIAVLNCLSNDVSILINRGDGTFLSEVRVPVGNVTQRGDPNTHFAYPGPFLALGDFNRDGAPDIAVPAQGRVKLLMNDGAGHFTLASTNPQVVGSSAYCIAVADLNHDGNPDMAVAVTTSGDDAASILLGRGDGTFQPAVAYDVRPVIGGGPYTIHVDAGDLEGNGSPDLVFSHEVSQDGVTVLRNRGDGTFFPREVVNGSWPGWFAGWCDLRNLGKPDLVGLSQYNRSPLRVNLNNGAGQLLDYTLTAPTAAVATDWFAGGAIGDIDGDGEPDVVVTVTNQNYQVRVYRGVGGGRFESQLTISLGFSGSACGDGVAIADLNGDGRPDLIVADPIVPGGFTAPGKVWVLMNTGGFTFAPPVAYSLAGVTPKGVVAADLNHDGRPDLAVWTTQVYPGDEITPVERRIAVLMNHGDGTFATPVSYTIWSAHWGPNGAVTVADLDRDGVPDLIGAAGTRSEPGIVATLRGTGDGGFRPWSTIPVATMPVSLVAADLRGQGQLDLAVMHGRDLDAPASLPQHYLTVLYNDGAGGFPTRNEYTDLQLVPGSDLGGQMAVADFDGDGRLDIALHDDAMMSVPVALNRGDGTFEPPVCYAVCGSQNGAYPRAVFAADLNHDGRPDLLTVAAGGLISFLPNLSCPFCYANCDGSTVPPVLTIADFACFLNRFASRDPVANCDGSTTAPTLNVQDFMCFLNKFAAGCP